MLVTVHKEKGKSHVEAWAKFRPESQIDKLGEVGEGVLLICPVSPTCLWETFLGSPTFCAYKSQASMLVGYFFNASLLV